MKLSQSPSQVLLNSRWLLPTALFMALGMGWVVSSAGFIVPVLLVMLPVLLFFFVLVFYFPQAGLISYIVYCFALSLIGRYLLPGLPVGMGMDALLILTWLAVLFHQSEYHDWTKIQNDLCLLALVWFIINIAEIGNPAGASIAGWFYEMRATTLYWVLTVPLVFILFNKQHHLQLFLTLIIALSVLGALYGLKQKLIGLDAVEQQWLADGHRRTHMIFGRLRVFSFYSEAAQFGASQAHVGLICIILALGPFVWWKRMLMAMAGILLVYGMLISGTRGAMFVIATGVIVYLVLSKKASILILGLSISLALFCVLKYTNIGNTNADIYRLRSSLNPQDASFQVRLQNQAKLREYLSSRPFGGGVGVIGFWGKTYNSDKYLSSIPPDSYYVKIWAEYGIVGFLIWFGMMLYILGKCCGIVWHIQNAQLRQKLLALTAGFGGVLVASYGNEVMNQVPSSMILYISWAFIFLGPQIDAKK